MLGSFIGIVTAGSLGHMVNPALLCHFQRAAAAPAAPSCSCQVEGFSCKGTIGSFILESARLAGNGMAEVMNSNEERGEC